MLLPIRSPAVPLNISGCVCGMAVWPTHGSALVRSVARIQRPWPAVEGLAPLDVTLDERLGDIERYRAAMDPTGAGQQAEQRDLFLVRSHGMAMAR